MLRRFAVLSVVLTLVVCGMAQRKAKGVEAEQSSFGGEEVEGVEYIKRPVALPDSVARILAEDEAVKGCLSENPPASGQSLSSWFLASEIHREREGGPDLVVLPVVHGESPMCFHSASGIGTFWVFRRTGEAYSLVLRTYGNGLTLLRKRNHGLRQIMTETIGSAGRYITTVTFHFDGKVYREYRRKTIEQK